MIKNMLTIAAILASCVAFAAADGSEKANLAAARAKITQLIAEPAKMTVAMKSLSKDDQAAFLAEVNAAIAAMPGNAAERTETFVAINNAALAGSHKGNALNLIAEVFATVPPYALVAVGESLSSGLMNRAADKSVTYTDEQYARISQSVMAKVNERVASENNAGVRSAIAGLMLINASNNASPEIVNAVTASLPENVRNDAKNEWYPAAMASGENKSYDAILAAADGDDYEIQKQVSEQSKGDSEGLVVLRAPAAVNYAGLLGDIIASSTGPALTPGERNPIVDALQNPLEHELSAGIGAPFHDTATIINQVNKTIDRNAPDWEGSGGNEGGDYQYQRR